MDRIAHYSSPLGEMTLSANESGLTGLWFDGQKYFGRGLPENCQEDEMPVFDQTRRWLDRYFAGESPDFCPPLHPRGTAFQQAVWKLLLTSPYGETVTYGDLARRLARQMGRASMSAQAVGGAVGRNPISVLIPCHRVLGADGSLTVASRAGLMHKQKNLVPIVTPRKNYTGSKALVLSPHALQNTPT